LKSGQHILGFTQILFCNRALIVCVALSNWTPIPLHFNLYKTIQIVFFIRIRL